MSEMTVKTPASAGVFLRCEAKNCDETFSRLHNSQRFCSRRCWMDTRNDRKREAARWMTPKARATRRAADFRRRGYGITPEDFDLLVELCDSTCRICLQKKTLVPDHCHVTDTFRGAICEACNHLLGKAYDDPAVLERAAAYLRQAT